MLVDIRDVPASRRPGFSKSALAAALSQAGIGYRHHKPLGDPKPGRDAARAGDYARFRRIFLEHIDSSAARTAMSDIIGLADSEAVCLLCYERDPTQCHRSLVLDRIATFWDIDIRHIGVVDRINRDRPGAGAGRRSRKGGP
ncbi:MAG: DUF488 family protein [Alphaproteobacteria bacterium]|nr:DUF488 family protein [Alphaproteobacteria bacterium]